MLATALVLSACRPAGVGTDGSPTATASPTEQAEPTATPEEALIEVSQSAQLGAILTDAEGRTVYLFTNDEGMDGSACTGGCAETWPPLTVESEAEAVAGADVTGELGTITRDDGSLQVTIAGHPLYHFSGDTDAGDTNGHGVGGVWFAVGPSGARIGSGSTSDNYY